jgi:hypothetical protein
VISTWNVNSGTDELARVVELVVEIGLQAGWAGFEDLRIRH